MNILHSIQQYTDVMVQLHYSATFITCYAVCWRHILLGVAMAIQRAKQFNLSHTILYYSSNPAQYQPGNEPQATLQTLLH